MWATVYVRNQSNSLGVSRDAEAELKLFISELPKCHGWSGKIDLAADKMTDVNHNGHSYTR